MWALSIRVATRVQARNSAPEVLSWRGGEPLLGKAREPRCDLILSYLWICCDGARLPIIKKRDQSFPLTTIDPIAPAPGQAAEWSRLRCLIARDAEIMGPREEKIA